MELMGGFLLRERGKSEGKTFALFHPSSQLQYQDAILLFKQILFELPTDENSRTIIKLKQYSHGQ